MRFLIPLEIQMFKNKFKILNQANKAPESPALKQHYFKENHRTYSCIHCRAHLASHDELVSKLFQGNHGRAYLFDKVVNVRCKQSVKRMLLTGPHTVADIYCENCETTLGWKYEQAFVPNQKYKEGKYIIEVVHMFKENSWDITSYNANAIMKEIELINRKKFDLRDFKIGDNYFGSINFGLNLGAKQNDEKPDLHNAQTKVLRIKSLDQDELNLEQKSTTLVIEQQKSKNFKLIDNSKSSEQPNTNANRDTSIEIDTQKQPDRSEQQLLYSERVECDLSAASETTEHDVLESSKGLKDCPQVV